ncbi:hypothetical protein [Helicobacter cetorum]|uniref:hypothetical protein n=1 Tax=Helicobacter cetorum TaxID=138563 RepID=UPI000CF198F3|nr:hypothetical protein [Helicobacter cetorum]
MKIVSFENDFYCDKHLLIPCKVYCVELEVAYNDLGLNTIEKCALKLKESGIKDKELKDFLGFKGELEPLMELILEKIETKIHEEYKKIYTNFYYNLINEEFLHFVDLECRVRKGNKLKNNQVEFYIDNEPIKAESLYYSKEHKLPHNRTEMLKETIKTSIKYHQQDILRYAKPIYSNPLEGVYYLHAKAFNDNGLRIECKNHPIKMAEKLKGSNPKFIENLSKRQYVQNGGYKETKRIKVFEKPMAFDDRLSIIEKHLSNLDTNDKKLKICGALHDVYEQIFEDEKISQSVATCLAISKDTQAIASHLGFEKCLNVLQDNKLNALLLHHEKVMQSLAKNYPSFLRDLNDLKKCRGATKHGGELKDDNFLTRIELERYRDEIYFLIENLLENPLIKDRENIKEKSHYRKNAEIDAQIQLSNLNLPKSLFECFVGVNLAKNNKDREEIILNLYKIFETILIKAIKKQPKLDFKTKNEILKNSSYKLNKSLEEVRESFLENAFKYKHASLGAYVLVLLSCGYFESVFEKVQEWLVFIAELIALRGHGHKMTKKLEKLEIKKLEELEQQALEYFKKMASKLYPKENQ